MDPTQVPLPRDKAWDNLMSVDKTKNRRKKKKHFGRKPSRWSHLNFGEDRGTTAHPFHRGFGNEITLVSEDDVEFVVSSSKLASHSTLFCDMFNDASLFSSSAQPIYIPYSSNVLELFIDLVSVANKTPILKHLDFEAIVSLLPFLDYAVCSELSKEVRHRLLKISKSNNFSLLNLASSMNDVGLAKIALRRLVKDGKYTGKGESNLVAWRNLTQAIRPSFQAELLSLILINTKSDTFLFNGKHEIDCNWIASNFNPDERQEVTDEEDVSTDEEDIRSEVQKRNVQVKGESHHFDDWSRESEEDVIGW